MDAAQWGYWLAGDLSRFSREEFIGINTGSSVKPSFTTANTEQVYKILKELLRTRDAMMPSNEIKEQESKDEMKNFRNVNYEGEK